MFNDERRFSPHLLELASVLVRDAIRIKEGQIVEVTLTGERCYMDFFDEITLTISQIGAFPVLRLNTPSYRQRFIQTVPEEYLMKPPPHMVKWIADINRHINIVADAPRFNPIHISEKRQQVHRDAQKKITGKIKQKNVTMIYVPTQELAEFCGIPLDRLSDALVRGLDISYPDLRKRCRSYADSLRGKDKPITILSGHSQKLTCSLKDRQVFIEDGRHELPAGMVFFSPIEASVEGSVMIPRFKCGDAIVRDLVLEFSGGRVIRSEAGDNHKVFQDVLKNSYGDSDAFAGIGIGMNPGISGESICPIIDFFARDKVHISLGSNLIFGGVNFSDLFLRLELDNPVVQINGNTIISPTPPCPDNP
ncbi:aminopeptidase [bacterium]|nr:aminopeptidase [candidate division CSSED10-310 bacterium]